MNSNNNTKYYPTATEKINKAITKRHQKEIINALNDIHEFHNPIFVDDEFFGPMCISETEFAAVLATKQEQSDEDKNRFEIPVDEEDNFLSVEQLFEEDGKLKYFPGFRWKHSFEYNNNTYTVLFANFYNHKEQAYRKRSYIINQKDKSHFPGLEKGLDECIISHGASENSRIKYLGKFGNKVIMIRKKDLFSTVCKDYLNNTLIGPESLDIKVHKQGNLDILEFNEYRNPDWNANDFTMKEPWFLGSDGLHYEFVVTNAQTTKDMDIVKNGESANTVLGYFRIQQVKEIKAPKNYRNI